MVGENSPKEKRVWRVTTHWTDAFSTMTQAEGRQVNVGFCSHHTTLLCAPLNHWIYQPKVYIALSNESLAKKI